MWLLSTDRAELYFFRSVQEAQRARFAILSHVWDESEQTFQETQALCVGGASLGLNPRDISSIKVRESCKLAERYGYKWIWNDTCCIDKTSSSELSEAINSMFAYYSHADVCYAYLKDVPADDQIHEMFSRFWWSRWFRRGWTLQELLAPHYVIFLSSAWTEIGTKAGLARTVSQITHIPESVLLLEKEISNMSVAQRMSWAAFRETTRPEDEAYCLLGIFNIHMPPLYGEGEQAFQRLQEEIMKKSTDSSLFASYRPVGRTALLAASPKDFSSASGFSFSSDTLYKIYDFMSRENPVSFSVAPMARSMAQHPDLQQPRPFDGSPKSAEYPTQLAGIPAFDITPYGIRARLPILKTSRGTVGILFVSTGDDDHMCLPVEKCNTFADSTRPLYRVVGSGDACRLFKTYCHTSTGIFMDACARWDQFFAAPWEIIYFAHGSCTPPKSIPTGWLRLQLNHDTTFPFYIHPGAPQPDMLMEQYDAVELVSETLLENSLATPGAAATLIFGGSDPRTQFRMHLGRCSSAKLNPSLVRAAPGLPQTGSPWVVVDWPGLDADAVSSDIAHNCYTDHVEDWTDLTRTWCKETKPHSWEEVKLSFSGPSQINPTQYVLTRIEREPLDFLLLDPELDEDLILSDPALAE